jgi:hypothetical protein
MDRGYTEERIRLNLALQEASDDVARLAMETIPDDSDLARQLAKHDVKPTQMHNLQHQVMAAGGMAEIELWIRYQMARSGTKEQWGESGLGQAVLKGLARLRTEKAQQIAAAVYPGGGEDYVAEVWLDLVRRYAGYLVRQFVAVRGE